VFNKRDRAARLKPESEWIAVNVTVTIDAGIYRRHYRRRN
jgi:hypothetical protein